MDYTFVIVDGPDGAGKGTIVSWIGDYLMRKGYSVFDLRTYLATRGGRYPNPHNVFAQVILSCEPTYSYQGRTLRNVLLKNGERYTPLEIAQAFALDRSILYNEFLEVCLKKGKIVIQERGLSSSLIYQPLDAKLRGENLTIRQLLSFDGNKKALDFPPSHLLIVYADTDILLKRCESRFKQDHSKFENKDFLLRLNELYLNGDWKKIFESRGTKIIYFKNNFKLDEAKKEIENIIENELVSKTEV